MGFLFGVQNFLSCLTRPKCAFIVNVLGRHGSAIDAFLAQSKVEHGDVAICYYCSRRIYFKSLGNDHGPVAHPQLSVGEGNGKPPHSDGSRPNEPALGLITYHHLFTHSRFHLFNQSRFPEVMWQLLDMDYVLFVLFRYLVVMVIFLYSPLSFSSHKELHLDCQAMLFRSLNCLCSVTSVTYLAVAVGGFFRDLLHAESSLIMVDGD